MNRELLNKELYLKAPSYAQVRVIRINHRVTLQAYNITSFSLFIYLLIVMSYEYFIKKTLPKLVL